MTANHVEPLRPVLICGALFALLAVMTGAFGAHGLRGALSERGLEVFQTAVTYQIYHSLALILVSMLPVAGLPRHLLGIAAGFFVAGILLFSGSLYLLVLTDMRWVGPVTPVGGISFMVGWILVIISGFRR
ncbi:DUF423 domain-containing protein [Marinobacter sp. TBZ242]|uniref:DUF423 domain-containing protein n=1 Tax=Marinobacter azerbaijanicus TaxID=3050455 RepID=A0ABT7IAI2_9GAMM|nr:DUF423 domain-containing protein [Marinobacter sp. TBZ242]MDL0431120.1 DUF423 domain-containing protein [Marinobacter sp. TBZ242]